MNENERTLFTTLFNPPKPAGGCSVWRSIKGQLEKDLDAMVRREQRKEIIERRDRVLKTSPTYQHIQTTHTICTKCLSEYHSPGELLNVWETNKERRYNATNHRLKDLKLTQEILKSKVPFCQRCI